MSDTNWKVGDVVRLKSGGPEMVVLAQYGELVPALNGCMS